MKYVTIAFHLETPINYRHIAIISRGLGMLAPNVLKVRLMCF